MKNKIILLVSTGLLAVGAFGAQLTINTGTNANDGTGDPIRTAFGKVNTNFAELYGSTVKTNEPRTVILSNPSNLFTGSIVGGATTISNQVILSLSRDFGVTGSGDETAKLQNALNAAKPVLIDRNISVTNVFATNGSHLIGDTTHKISFATNGVGYCIDVISTNSSNIFFEKVCIDGLNYGFNGSGNGTSSPWTCSGSTFAVTQQITGSSRDGFHAPNGGWGGAVKNPRITFDKCLVRGMSGAAFSTDGFAITFPQPVTGTTKLSECTAEMCWQGFRLFNCSEYMVVNNCVAAGCGIGVDKSSGNVAVHGGQYTRNGIGIKVAGSGVSNPAHCVNTGIVLNHNDYPFQCEGFTNGETFLGCQMLGGGDVTGYIAITNCAGVAVIGCYVGVGAITNSGGGPNYLINNMVDVTYPSVSSINNGVLLQNGWLNAGAAAVMTNNFTNLFSAPMSVPGSLTLGTNTVSPSLVYNLGAWDGTDALSTTPMFYVDGPSKSVNIGAVSSQGGAPGQSALNFIEKGGVTVVQISTKNSRMYVNLPLSLGKNDVTAGSTFDNVGLSLMSGLTVTNAPTFGTTNSAPPNVTVGTTTADRWLKVTNNGTTYVLPMWNLSH